MTASEISVSVPVSDESDPGGTPSAGVSCASTGGGVMKADNAAAPAAKAVRRSAIGLRGMDRKGGSLFDWFGVAGARCEHAAAESMPGTVVRGQSMSHQMGASTDSSRRG
ncbi:hypothetical protein GCM10010403_01770 [Glycomyces rutgersensis]|uniref:Uncharacterized protein n=1 Tax=Glycomyces rutgersensis TaxID=58115 RepID=A0ABN3F7A8_9ACTN